VRREAMTTGDDHGQTRLLKARVDELMSAEPYTIGTAASLQDAAALMRRHRITCLPVVEHDRLLGLLTESMLVEEVVLRTRDALVPVSAVMQPDPLQVRPDQPVVDVIAIMTRQGVAHVPVTLDGRLVGIVTQTDLVRRQAASSVFMVIDIARADSAEAMIPVIRQVPSLLMGLIDAGASAQEIGRVSTSVTGAVTRRLIELAEIAIGAAPVAFAWLACGSQGRQEQTTVSDQDNCLVLADDYDVAVHGEWASALATFVCHGLDATGYALCKGGMMAMNPDFRHTVSGWTSEFERWTTRPDEHGRLMASFMADARAVAGDERLATATRERFLDTASSNRFFIARMLGDALAHGPALTVFGRLLKGGDKSAPDRVDLKRGGVVPVIDLARVHALAGGTKATNTVERLTRVTAGRGLDSDSARELVAAYEFISTLRLRHQTEQTRLGRRSDNFILPEDLSRLDREHLRDALEVVRRRQKSLETRVTNSGF